MTLSLTLRTAARNLINTFGNSGTIYHIASATSTLNDEGDRTVTSWGTGTAVKVVDGTNAVNVLTQASVGLENVGEDEKILRDDASPVINDRLTESGNEFRITDVSPVLSQDNVVIYIIKVNKVTSTTAW